MQQALSKQFDTADKDFRTGEEAYNAIINQLQQQIADNTEMLRVLSIPCIKDSFINYWVPDMATFTVEYGGD